MDPLDCTLDNTATGLEPPTAGESAGGLFVITYVAAAFGIWVAVVAPATVTLAVRIAEVSPKGFAALYSLVAGVGGLISIPASPIAGRLSDVSGSRFGRRRPYIVTGGVVALVGAGILATTSSTVTLVSGWALVMIGNQVSLVPFWAMISDRVSPKRQGLLAGLAGAMQSGAALAGTWYAARAHSTTTMLIAPPAVGLGLVLLFAVLVPEQQVLSTEPANLTQVLRGLVFNPIRERGLVFALVAIGLLTAAISVTTLYALYYLRGPLGVGGSTALEDLFRLTLISNVCALAAAPVAGHIGDRLGRRSSVYGSAAILAAAGLLTIQATKTVDGLFIGAAFIGVASGVFAGQSLSLVMSLGDASVGGRNLGLVSVAMQLPYSLVPLVASVLLRIGGGDSNFVALWMASAIAALLVVPALHLAQRYGGPRTDASR